MKKFENTLLISDIDGTLIDCSWEISNENKEAVRYFTENGGIFTYATGRQAPVAKMIVEQLMPNAPVICYNGAAIYDYSTESYLWTAPLDSAAAEVIEDIMENCPDTNIEINAADAIYLVKTSPGSFARYEKLVPFFKKVASIDEVPKPWLKLVFAMKDEYMPVVRGHVEARPYFKKFQFCQSASWLYELLTFNVNKGTALPQLVKILGKISKTIAVGDNENDIEFIKAADVGFAVKDGSPLLLKHCTNLTVSQKEHPLADIIEKLDKNLI